MPSNNTHITLTASVHRGTGKSLLTANLAAQAALSGLRVGMFNACMQTPWLHVYFGYAEGDMPVPFGEALAGNCPMSEAVRDVTPILSKPGAAGKLYLATASQYDLHAPAPTGSSFDFAILSRSVRVFCDIFHLDALFIDTQAGISEDNLALVALPDTALLLLRPDHQDYQGTAVLADVACRLQVPRPRLVMNGVLERYDFEDIKSQMEKAFRSEVAAVLPFSEEVSAQGSRGLFTLNEPEHPFSAALRKLSNKLLDYS